MNVFNRFLIILASLIILVSAVAVLLVTLNVYGPADLAPSPWFQDRLNTYADLDPTTWNWTVGVSIAVIIASLILLLVEVWPHPQGSSRLLLKRDGLGEITMTRESVRDIVNWEAGQVDGVMEAQSRVFDGPDGLRINCRVSLAPQASVPDATAALQDRIKSAVEHHVGRHVSQVLVDTQLAPLTARARVR